MDKDKRLAKEVEYLEEMLDEGVGNDPNDVPGLLHSIAATLTVVAQELSALNRTIATGGGEFPLTELAAMVASGEAREIREKAGVSQEQLARLLGVDDSTLGGWERGDWFPSQASSRRYLAALRELEVRGD